LADQQVQLFYNESNFYLFNLSQSFEHECKVSDGGVQESGDQTETDVQGQVQLQGQALSV
jgi:hypothetical protein